MSVYEMETEKKTFGQPSKPRDLEPSMYDLLSWDINPNDIRYSKKSKNIAKYFGDYNRYKNMLDRANGKLISESHDAYRPFYF